MTIPKITPYTGGVANPDGSQTQTEFTQNMFDQLSYEANLSTELNSTVDGINDTATQVDADATSASQSAAAAEAAASGLDYKGLWPDTGGVADKGDTYQTQVSGTPTGQYFTALQNTTVDPVGDDVNWREVISIDNVTTLTDPIITTKSQGNASDPISSSSNVDYGVGAIYTSFGLLFWWDDGSDFPAFSHVVSAITQNDFNGFDVTTNNGTFEFVSDEVRKARKDKQLYGWCDMSNLSDITLAMEKALAYNPRLKIETKDGRQRELKISFNKTQN